MRNITLGAVAQNATPAKVYGEGVVSKIDGVYWCWVDRYRIWLRLPKESDMTPHFVHQAPPHAVTFVRQVVTGARRGPVLPVQRTSPTEATVGSVPVLRFILDGIRDDHGEVDWRLRDRWLVAYVGKMVVAIWKMPDDYHLAMTRMVLHEGAVWLTDGHFACKLTDKMPPAALEKIRKLAEQDAGMSAGLATMAAGAAEGAVVVPKIEGDVVLFGESRVPHGQFVTIQANCGKEIVWYWTAPTDPIVGKVAGNAVAFLMPLKSPLPATASPGGAA